uniref:C-type lectin domain-containing protein n=1 Tax=Astyanax mexicanus TaxID=7994 RepID=A0A8B9KM82_ASTMX
FCIHLKTDIKTNFVFSPEQKCQNGWSQFGHRCFMIFKNSADWPASEENCVAMGGHLASVHSSEEHTFIVNLVLNATSSDSAWIGGSDTAQEGAWVWTDGMVYVYTSHTTTIKFTLSGWRDLYE